MVSGLVSLVWAFKLFAHWLAALNPLWTCSLMCPLCVSVSKGWLVCEDQACQNRIRRLPIAFCRYGPICPACTRATLRPEVNTPTLWTAPFPLHLWPADGAVALECLRCTSTLVSRFNHIYPPPLHHRLCATSVSPRSGVSAVTRLAGLRADG